MNLIITPCGLQQSDDLRGLSSNKRDQSFRTGAVTSISHVPQLQAVLSLSRSKRLILLRRQSGFAIWQIGNGKKGRAAGWSKIAEVELKGKTSATSGMISDDGQWIIVGDLWRTSVWQLVEVGLFVGIYNLFLMAVTRFTARYWCL